MASVVSQRNDSYSNARPERPSLVPQRIQIPMHQHAELARSVPRRKKLLQIFGRLEKLLYLCTRNSKERGFGSVWALWVVVKFCWWAWRWAHLYIIGVRRTSEALEKKNFSENLVVSKKLSYLCTRNSKERVVGSVRYIVGAWWRWQLTETLAESIWWLACQADLEARWGVCWKGSPTDESRSAKKTSPKIWWFQKLVVPLHSQPTRKGSSLFTREEVLSWSF